MSTIHTIPCNCKLKKEACECVWEYLSKCQPDDNDAIAIICIYDNTKTLQLIHNVYKFDIYTRTKDNDGMELRERIEHDFQTEDPSLTTIIRDFTTPDSDTEYGGQTSIIPNNNDDDDDYSITNWKEQVKHLPTRHSRYSHLCKTCKVCTRCEPCKCKPENNELDLIHVHATPLHKMCTKCFQCIQCTSPMFGHCNCTFDLATEMKNNTISLQDAMKLTFVNQQDFDAEWRPNKRKK